MRMWKVPVNVLEALDALNIILSLWCAEASVNKTGRLIVSHEASVTSGFGAEVTATITNRCFASLESPPARVCGYDTPFPLIYEPVYLPTAQRVADAVQTSLHY